MTERYLLWTLVGAGRELSPRGQASVFAISVGIGVLALAFGLSIPFLGRGPQS